MTVVIVGAGINGLCAALEMRRRGYDVTVVDPGPLPHPLAASTDISKAIRAAYGADEIYTELAERAIPLWREWNIQLGGDLYHESGCLFVKQGALAPGEYEFESIKLLAARGHRIEQVDAAQMRLRFPAWNTDRDWHGLFAPDGGYAESSRVVAALAERAVGAGVRLRESTRFVRLDENGKRVRGVVLATGDALAADHVIVAAGAWTPSLLPFTRIYFRATGQPVFHLRPAQPALFAPERFPMFGADISTSGYYGFPLNREGVVKIGKHGAGREMSPDSAERVVTAEEENEMRGFVASTFPPLADAALVFTRLCMYCDTPDGDFWIAADPERPGLTIAAGDNGHGFKFAPVLGELIADAAEEKPNRMLERFRWRPGVRAGAHKEAARARS
ncbi:MAG: FAD-dependent oxidoreductase [Chthoniobacterales bacterium]